MIIFIIALAIMCVVGIKFSFKDGFADYCSPERTGAIKGIFVFIVVLSHARSYFPILEAPQGAFYREFLNFFGQLMVVVFLMYSGYGVWLAIKNKDGYIKAIPTKRAFKVWLHFAIAVTVFYIVGLCLGKGYSLKTLLLSYIGLSGVGNSAWFIIDIIILYLLTFAAFAVCGRKHMLLGTIVTTVLSFGALLALRKWQFGNNWWYDTVMCYPLGMWYAMAKPYIDKHILPSFWKWLLCTLALGAAFGGFRYLIYSQANRLIFFIPASFAFGLLIIFLSMRISLNNAVLRWFGKRVFGVYILQRIPMIVLSHFGAESKPVLFTAACIAITIVIAEVFEQLMGRLDIALHLSKKPKKAVKEAANI